MNKKIIISAVLLLTILTIGISFFLMKEKESKNKAEEVKNITEEKISKEIQEDITLEPGEVEVFNKEMTDDGINLESEQEELMIKEDKNINGWYEIPEIGIKFPVDKKTEEELIYVYKNEEIIIHGSIIGSFDVVQFSTKFLKNSDEYCAPRYSPLGSLSVYGQEIFEKERWKNISSKEINSKKFVYDGPQAVCTAPATDPYIQTNILNEMKRYFSLEKIEKL